MSLSPFVFLGIFAAWTVGCEEAGEVRLWSLSVAEECTVPATSYRPAPAEVTPRISSVSPSRGLIGTSLNVTIEGDRLQSHPSVRLGGIGVTAVVQSSSSTTITATLTISPAATAGNHSVTVTSGDRTSNAQDFFVQAPTGLTVASVATLPTGTSGEYGCTPSMNFGIKVDVRYQVVDQDGNPISSNRMQPQEEVVDQVINGIRSSPVPEWKDIGPSRISGTSKFTDSKGQYLDAPLGICGDVPFRASVDQEVSVLVNGHRYQVRAQSLEVSSSKQGQGHISNSLDISRSRP